MRSDFYKFFQRFGFAAPSPVLANSNGPVLDATRSHSAQTAFVGAAGNRFARDNKEPGPNMKADKIPGERPCEIAETQHASPKPNWRVRRKGAAPLSGA